jgi:adenylyl-sulfate kinase
MLTTATENLTWHRTSITKRDRQELKGHSSFAIWFTGLSGAGKSTLANVLEETLLNSGVHTYLLDGDNLRMGINGNLGFSEKDRQENIRRVAEVARLFVDAGIVVIVAVISPKKEDRDNAKLKFKHNEFLEVFVDCPIEVCQKRDPKGLYRKATQGKIKNFTGIDSPYEPPGNPDIIAKTNIESVDENVQEIIETLQFRGML